MTLHTHFTFYPLYYSNWERQDEISRYEENITGCVNNLKHLFKPLLQVHIWHI